MEPINVCHSQNILGEGPIWNVNEQTVYWVDIDGKIILRYSPKDDDYASFSMPIKVSFLAFRKHGGFIIGTEKGLYFWDRKKGNLDFITHPESRKKDSRFNDGKVDRRGRLWAGTMTSLGATSSLYRMDSDHTLHTMLTNITISNGIGWSPDNSIMYYVDSLRYVIYAFDFNINTATITNQRSFIQLNENIGVPDGLTVDIEGYVWCAIYDGWKVMRFDPFGKVDVEIEMPISRPSCCAFGGKDMDELFITTISEGLSTAQKEKEPMAGDLFMVKTSTKGVCEPEFSG